MATPSTFLHIGDRGDGDRQGDDAQRATAPVGETKAGVRLAGANPAATHVLQYSIPANGHVKLEVFAVTGRLVRTLVDQDAAAGSFRATWDGRDNGGAQVSRGVYFARYTVDGRRADDRKLVLE